MPASAKHKFPFPEEWDADAEAYISDTEMTFDDAPEKPRFPETLFVYNLPKVAKPVPGETDKFARLQTAIKKKLGKGEEDPGFELDMRIDESTGESTGCAWLKYPSKTAMENARKVIDGLKFGQHVLNALPFDEYERIMETPEAFVSPPSARANLSYLDDCRNWCLDEAAREQLLLRFQQETEIHWLDPLQSLVPYYCGEREKEKGKVWCDWKVQWSLQGNFLVTCHKPGICLWGGESMNQKRKFIHDSVKEVMFSPTEEYLCTWNGAAPGEDRSAYKIWNVQTGRILKEVPTPLCNPSGENGMFPHMVFSPDSKFFARCTEREISVHEMPSCKLHKRPGQAEAVPFRFENGVSHFKFSPKDNVISVWSPQLNDSPSCLTVTNVETGERLQTRSRTNFNAKLEWQSEGDFLCVVLSRKGKIKDGKEQVGSAKTRNLDILRMREKNIPVETVDVEENIKGFFWEPKSNRFALLTEHKESNQKTVLVFYSLANSKCEQVASFELNSGGFNKLFWAPEGQYFVVAAMGASGGDLVWGRLSEQNNMELLYKDDQVGVTNVEWDATGRFVLTSVIMPIEAEKGMFSKDIASAQDAGFTLWTFQGRPLHQELIEKLYGANFRPKPPTLLKGEEEKDIRRQLKVHSRRFEQIDDDARTKQRREERERKEHKIAEFRVICHTLNQNFGKHAQNLGWQAAQDRYKKAHAWSEKPEMTEELVETKEEFIEF